MVLMKSFVSVTILILVQSVINSLAQLLPANFTQKERTALREFRSLLGSALYRDFMQRDEYLIRWIVDQNYKLDRAHDKLLTALKWRKDNKLDTILDDEDFSDIEKLCKYTVDGRDRIGRPILAASLGPCPLRRIVLGGNIDRLHRMLYYAFEAAASIVHNLQSEGKPIVDGLLIVDLNNFNLREHGCLRCVPLVLDVLTLYESYYPLYIDHIFVINVPRVAEFIFPLALPLMSERTRRSLHVFGFDRTEWQRAILNYVAPEELEPTFGGTKPPKRFVPFSKIWKSRMNANVSLPYFNGQQI